MRHIFWIAAVLVGAASAAEPHVPVKWPVPWCDAEVIASASPAPAVSNSNSLAQIPFSTSIIPFSAAVIVSLTPEYRPVIECVVDPGYQTGFELVAIDAVAGLVLSTPLAVNEAAPGGRYLVRVTTLFGISWIDPPPNRPILPNCKYEAGIGPVPDRPPAAPKPTRRVPPVYPARAEEEGIEGTVVIMLDIFSSGEVTPKCFAEATPAGWFEDAALTAVAQYRFPSTTTRGHYLITIKFRMED